MNNAVMPNSARKVQLSDSRLLMERAVSSWAKTIPICAFHICGFGLLPSCSYVGVGPHAA